MEDKLRLNTKLYGFDGIIGRRDYFLNCVYISSIALLVLLPIMNWIYTNVENLTNIFSISSVFAKASFGLKLWAIVGIAGVCTLSLSNIFRRLNDICGEVNTHLQITYAVFTILPAFWMFTPTGFNTLITLISNIMLIYLLFKRGKITSKYPYDFRKEFNWGAFLGTWVWGLFNKSYATMWQLVIGCTPWSVHYALYCGLKGNEWAFKNKKYTDVKDFNSSQKQQSIIFAVLTFIVMPFLYFVLIFGIVAAIMLTSVDVVKNNPEKAKNIETNLSKFVDGMGSIFFKNYEITENENKFYVLNSDWNSYAFNEKMDIMKFAASLAADKRRKLSNNSSKHFSKTTEFPRTKIYSSETGQLLGEFVIDETILKSENVSAKEIFKSTFKAFRFYKAK